MKGYKNCRFCNGTGTYLMSEDLHRSAGWVPCSHKPEGTNYESVNPTKKKGRTKTKGRSDYTSKDDK